uniref:Uncharacterized protein n=1 Tax=Stomoxys calcitrans TaxID=35570 RepID=A0A1I8PQ29_STOCA
MAIPKFVHLKNLLWIVFSMHRYTQDEDLPEFSEIYLRVAFLKVFGKDYAIKPDVLQLYRKLLVLYYCQQYPSISNVFPIMERCFSLNNITNIIAQESDLKDQWEKFMQSEISNNMNEKTQKWFKSISQFDNTNKKRKI